MNIKFYKEKQKFYPIVIHAAMLGSIERFMYFLLEKNQSFFPFWCSKFVLCNLSSEKNNVLVKEICDFLRDKELNFSVNTNASETLKKNNHFPILFLGDKETKERKLKVKNLFSKEQEIIDIDDFFNYINIRMELFSIIFKDENI